MGAQAAKHEALIALGGNLGEVLPTFRWALAELCKRGIEVVAVSSALRTKAMVEPGDLPGPDYYNAAARLRTSLSAEALLTEMQAIEAASGRVRTRRWAPRVLDLDLLTYEDRVISTPTLTVPHPRLCDRNFVLWPLSEIAPEIVVPGTGQSISELLRRLPDRDAGILARESRWLERR